MKKRRWSAVGILLLLSSYVEAQELSLRVPFMSIGTTFPMNVKESGLHSLARSTNFHYVGVSYTWVNKLRLNADYSGETWKLNWLSATRAREMTGVPIAGNGFPNSYLLDETDVYQEQLASFSILVQKSWDLGWIEVNLGPGLRYYWDGYKNDFSILYFAGSKLYRLSGGYTYKRTAPYLGLDIAIKYRKRLSLRCYVNVLHHQQRSAHAKLERVSGIAATEQYELNGIGNDSRWELGCGLYYLIYKRRRQ